MYFIQVNKYKNRKIFKRQKIHKIVRLVLYRTDFHTDTLFEKIKILSKDFRSNI